MARLRRLVLRGRKGSRRGFRAAGARELASIKARPLRIPPGIVEHDELLQRFHCLPMLRAECHSLDAIALGQKRGGLVELALRGETGPQEALGFRDAPVPLFDMAAQDLERLPKERL